MEFRLLGPVEASDGGRQIVLAGTKQAALLARLLLDANRVVPAERLIDDLWDGRPPASAVPTLQGYIAALRRALQPGTPPARHILQTRRPGYVLEIDEQAVDVRRFRTLLREGEDARTRQEHDAAAQALREALALWRGDALADVADLQFAAEEARRLEDARAEAVEGLVAADLALGRHLQVVGDLETMVTASPLHEPLTGALMLALYRSGRQAEALARYHALHRRLADELGIDPSPELQRLQEAILLQKAELDWEPIRRIDPSAARPAAPPDDRPVRSNLPLELTSLIGREAEASAILLDLRDARLVTLIGAGGVGKSRLALRVGRDVAEEFPDGVWLVELTAVSEADQLGERILAVLDRTGSGGRDGLAALAEHIGATVCLLVLDGCEHLAAACSALVTRLLQACPGLRVLATSREPLRVPGERLRRVSSLTVPEDGWSGDPEDLRQFAATTLFVERASTTDPGFALNRTDAGAVARLCRRLDGIPLAIELAAARARMMSPVDLASRIDDSVGVIGTQDPAVPPRHRTLQAVMDWSFALLPDDERVLLAELSVFSGSFGLDAAEHVCLAEEGRLGVIDALAGLVDKSLVVAEDRGAHRRYRLLQTVRQYAQGKLEDIEGGRATRDRHARHFLAAATSAAPLLYGPGLTTRLADLAADHENYRAALQHMASVGDPDEVCLAAALWRYCYLRGHYRDGRAWVTGALQRRRTSAAPQAVANATCGAATLAFLQCDYEQARTLAGEALRAYRDLEDRHGEGAVLTLLGSIAREKGDYGGAIRLHEQSLAIAEERGDRWEMAHRMQMCGFAAWLGGDCELARAWADRRRGCRDAEDEERTAWGLIDAAAVCHYTGQTAAAVPLVTESLALCRRLAFAEGIAWSLDFLGRIAHAQHDDATAIAHLTESLRLHAEVGDRWRAASVLEALAAALADSRAALAATLLGAAASTRDTIGTPVPPCEQPLVDRARVRLAAALGAQGFDERCAVGATLSVQAAARLLGHEGVGRRGGG